MAIGSGHRRHAVAEPIRVFDVITFISCTRARVGLFTDFFRRSNCFDKVYAGWELSTTYCMIVTVDKKIDQRHRTSEVRATATARPWSYLPTHSTSQSDGSISSFFFSFAQSLPIVHHSTDQSESDMGVVCGAMPAV